MKHKTGDIVRIIANDSYHLIPIGTDVVILAIDDDINCYKATNFKLYFISNRFMFSPW